MSLSRARSVPFPFHSIPFRSVPSPRPARRANCFPRLYSTLLMSIRLDSFRSVPSPSPSRSHSQRSALSALRSPVRRSHLIVRAARPRPRAPPLLLISWPLAETRGYLSFAPLRSLLCSLFSVVRSFISIRLPPAPMPTPARFTTHGSDYCIIRVLSVSVCRCVRM